MSSKFNPGVDKKTVVPWCKAPPDPALIPFPPGLYPVLNCFAKWADHDPLKYAHMSEAFALPAVTPGQEYYGESSTEETRLGLRVRKVPASELWSIDFYIWDPWRDPEDFDWPLVKPDAVDPLKLHPEADKPVPGEDYREVWVYG